jgi:putative transposase
MLAAALEAEGAAYIAAHLGELDERGRRLVVRNGHAQPCEVLTSSGGIGVHAPRVNDKRIDGVTGERRRFASVILPAWCRKSPKINEVLPLLYLHGLSNQDAAGLLQLQRVSTWAVGRATDRNLPRILDRFCPVPVLACATGQQNGPTAGQA